MTTSADTKIVETKISKKERYLNWSVFAFILSVAFTAAGLVLHFKGWKIGRLFGDIIFFALTGFAAIVATGLNLACAVVGATFFDKEKTK